MKLFKNIFKPKWKNNDPEIRKQALIHLDKDSNQDAFMEVAQNDPVPELRLLALKRITDLEKVNRIAKSDSDSRIKDYGNKLLCQLLSGEAQGNLDTQQRLEKIKSLDNDKVLEYIAHKGTSAELRMAAINKVNRESLLGNLAINDNNAEIRRTAINRVSQKSTLERVYKTTKTKDKVISRIAKEKLDEIIANEQLPIKLLNEQKEICAKIEALGSKGLWERDKIQFDNLTAQWQTLAENQTLELQHRFDDACARFSDQYQKYFQRHEEQLAKEAELLPIKEKKQQIITELGQLLASLENTVTLSDEQMLESKETLQQKEQHWDAIAKLPAELESELSAQYNDISRTVRKIISSAEHEKTLLNNFKSLEKRIDTLLGNTNKLTEKALEQIQNQLNTLSIGQLSQAAADHKNTINSKLSNANSKLAEKHKRSKDLISEIEIKFPKLDQALTEGILKDAISFQKSIQTNLKKLEKLNTSELANFKHRLAAASAKIGDLNNWRSWANTPQKEALIKQMEALIGSDDDPKEIAFLVSQARKDWRKLGASEKETSQELWEKFQEVCDKAFEPCKAYFEQEAEIREKNYQARLAFLENFEQFINITNWETVDWKKVEQLYRQAKNDWRDLGQTDPEQRKELNKRFYNSYNVLRDKLKEEWTRNIDIKQKLIDSAAALESEEDLQAAINQAKDLQRAWKNSGRVEPTRERKLWADFKTACDKIFARRQQLIEEKEQEAADNVQRKESLCEQLEAIAQKPLAEIDEVKSDFNKLQTEFNSIHVNVKEKEQQQLKRRITAALNIFERKLESLGKLEKLNALKKLKENANLCEMAEHAIAQQRAKDEVDAIINRIQQTEKVDESHWLNKLEKRITRLNALNASENLAELMQQNFEDLNTATIQLEILADVDTPDEYAEERLKIQAQRLSEKLQNHEEKGSWELFLSTEANWLCIGPVADEQLSELKARRARAISSLCSEFPLELENYL